MKAVSLLIGLLGVMVSAAPAAESTTNVALLLQPAKSPLVTFRILFQTGAAYDPAGKEGVAALTAALVAEGGSQRLSYEEIIKRMYPNGEVELKRLSPEHPIFRSEYPLDGADVNLWGVDFGCRTAIVYSPEDISCLWNKWCVSDPPNRPLALKLMITKATHIGVNVLAYATGREPLNKPEQAEIAAQTSRNARRLFGLPD